MPTTSPVLHLLCGKIASGKSTLAARLADHPGTITISEDVWLGALFADQMSTGADYLHYAARLKEAMGPHIVALLRAGVSVVLDFPANTPDQRAWFRSLIDDSGADHQMHVLAPPDEVCLARLRARNAEGEHAFAATEAQFHRFAKHFSVPGEDEGFALIHH